VTKDLKSRRTLTTLVEESGLPKGFGALSASDRLKVLLDLPDPGRFVRSLRADELHHLIVSIGIGDAHDLIVYATSEQRRAFIDLDSWSGCRWVPARLDRIIELALDVSVDFALSTVGSLGDEVLALHVFKSCSVSLVHDNVSGDGLPDATFESPDGEFWISCGDKDDIPRIRRFMGLMFAKGVAFAHRILLAGMNDTVSSLEEQAFYLRDARLQDLGFPSYDERVALWEPFDTGTVRRQIEEEEPAGRIEDIAGGRSPAVTLADSGSPLFLWTVFQRISDIDVASNWAEDTLYLVNRVTAATTNDFSRSRTRDEAAAHALALASIGMEELAGGDPDRGSAILRRTHPVVAYRIGVEHLRPLNLSAREVARFVGGISRLDVLGELRAETVRSCLVFPPRLWVEAVKGRTAERRDFHSRKEVDTARQVIDGCVNVLSYVRDNLGFAFEKDAFDRRGADNVTLATVLATAWAGHVVSGDPSPRPMSGEDIRDLVSAAFKGGQIRPSLRDTGPVDDDDVRTFMSEALDAVEEALGGLDPGKPVAVRFLGEVLLVDYGEE